jgi:protein-L-isoaspartate(D-aspartate) O-methyltransferase
MALIVLSLSSRGYGQGKAGADFSFPALVLTGSGSKGLSQPACKQGAPLAAVNNGIERIDPLQVDAPCLPRTKTVTFGQICAGLTTMSSMNIEQARFNMIEQQIRPWDVLDDRVLGVLASMPREKFVPDQYASMAFSDFSIPLAHEQFMMAPKLEGKLLQSLSIEDNDSILEVGTGSAYLTACLARLGNNVHSVDLYADFTTQASARLEEHGINNVTLETADAAAGLETEKRFDVIAITGSLPVLHRNFHTLLNPGGRLFVIVGKPPVMEALLITRVGEQEWNQESLFETSVPALQNAPQPESFTL